MSVWVGDRRRVPGLVVHVISLRINAARVLPHFLDAQIRPVLLAELVVSLNKNASYVDINCDDDLAILLSSGYEAVSTNRAQRVLNAPVVLAVENGQSGELRPRVKANHDTKSFVGRIKPLDGEYGPTISFQLARDPFPGIDRGGELRLRADGHRRQHGQERLERSGLGMAQ